MLTEFPSPFSIYRTLFGLALCCASGFRGVAELSYRHPLWTLGLVLALVTALNIYSFVSISDGQINSLEAIRLLCAQQRDRTAQRLRRLSAA